jgi:hypothetical protein
MEDDVCGFVDVAEWLMLPGGSVGGSEEDGTRRGWTTISSTLLLLVFWRGVYDDDDEEEEGGGLSRMTLSRGVPVGVETGDGKADLRLRPLGLKASRTSGLSTLSLFFPSR